MAKNEIAKQDDSNQVPDYLKNYEGQIGMSSMDSSDVVIPRIKLLQSTSQEPEEYNNAKPGVFWHTGLDIPLGEEVDFVVCLDHKRFLLIPPIDDPRTILARADDAENWDCDPGTEFTVKIKNVGEVKWVVSDKNVADSGLTDWGTYNPNDENSPPAATLFYEYLVLPVGENADVGLSILSCARSQIKPAKTGLNSKIQNMATKGRPMTSIKFTMGRKKVQGDSGDFWNVTFKMNGFVEQDTFLEATQIRENMEGTAFRAADETGAANEGDEKTAAKKVDDNGEY